MDNQPALVSLAQALAVISTEARLCATESVSLTEAFGRVLAIDLEAPADVPPFHKSAMDGYAIRHADMGCQLKVIGTIAAGENAKSAVIPGHCIRIMTGARVPLGADCVVMKEDVTELGNSLIQINNPHTKTNICLQGEDIRKGQTVLHKGQWIGAAQTALLAGMGISHPEVFCQPRLTVYATGSELAEPGNVLGAAAIYNSNSYQTLAQLRMTGIMAHYGGIIPDLPEAILQAIKQAAENSDVILFTGGVSAGDFDYLPKVLVDSGFTLLVNHLAIQPGKPMIFARRGKTVCFALSGNPVSSYLQTLLLVVPYLYNCMGHHYQPTEVQGVLKQAFVRKNAGRDAFIPVHFSEGVVEQIPYNGSAHIEAYCRANALLHIPAGTYQYQQDSTVHVRLL